MTPRIRFALPLLAVMATASAGEVRIDGRTFRVPDGFTVEKVAGPGLVDRPIVADFDEKGRLYVADSSGSNDAPQAQLKDPTHRIVRLEDSDGDGTFDKSVVFADKMMFPEGAMWRDGSLYVAAPPSIWKLTDTDGDGVRDKREEWFQGKTLTGCANDLHGPYNGPDGWIYWTKGAFAEQTYTLPDGKPFKTRAAHIFRARPDGTGIEPVMTGGMDNPVEVAWSPSGELFFTTTFLQHPGGGKRDGIIHAFGGGLWGKDHDVLDGHLRTGPELSPVMTHLGPAAPSGLMRYESDAFGKPYDNNLFCAQFNMHKVSRHVLIADGPTFKTEDHDFLTVSDGQDFHPTDVLEDADGSVLVLDTGGWYKLCCPTSQIGKPDVLGAIYRVRRLDAPKVDDPRGLKIDWAGAGDEELIRKLDDPRPAVRHRAIAVLGARPFGALDPEAHEGLAKLSPEARRNAVWASARSSSPQAWKLANEWLEDEDLSVRHAAWRVLTLDPRGDKETQFWRHGPKFLGYSTQVHAKAGAATIRVILESVGRLGDRGQLMKVLSLADDARRDRIVQGVTVEALVRMNDAPGLRRQLGQRANLQDHMILTALDQMGEPLPVASAKTLLDDHDESHRAFGEWLVARHPEVADALAPDLERALRNPRLDAETASRLGRQLARFANATKIRALIATLLTSDDLKPDRRLLALDAALKSGFASLPPEWGDGLARAIRDDDPRLAGRAIEAARALHAARAASLEKALGAAAEREDLPLDARIAALKALLESPRGTPPGRLFRLLQAELAPDKAASARLDAADVLAKFVLSDDQLAELADSVRTAGPLELPRLLAAFDRARDERIGRLLIAALKDSPALTSLPVADLRARFARFGPSIASEAAPLYARIESAHADQKAKLDDLAKSIGQGDVRRGQAIFNGTKAACASCHAIGYLGGNIGPDLSRIGAIREERDLLESIVYPSASFVRSYEPIVVATREGQVHSGVLRKDSPEEVVLATGPDKEVRVPRSDVEAMKPGTVSVMPAGLDGQLTRQELADLIAFLKSRK